MSSTAPSFRPLYLQIKGLLKASLAAGEWRPAEAIPSEQELAGRFGVSQGTVRKAIDALAADNLLVRRQGKGTFVATHTEERASNFRFLRIRRDDAADEVPASRLIDVRRGKAGAEVARALDLKPGAALGSVAPAAPELDGSGREIVGGNQGLTPELARHEEHPGLGRRLDSETGRELPETRLAW